MNAADYGVPQTRERAILLSSLDGPIQIPDPTHHETGLEPGLFGSGREPWRSMSSVLDRSDRWKMFPDETESFAARKPGGRAKPRSMNEPSFTIRAWKSARHYWEDEHGNREQISPEELLALQTFPADVEVRGSLTQQGKQIGNAVPPLLAAALLEELVR